MWGNNVLKGLQRFEPEPKSASDFNPGHPAAAGPWTADYGGAEPRRVTLTVTWGINIQLLGQQGGGSGHRQEAIREQLCERGQEWAGGKVTGELEAKGG